ncbi:MAG: AtpZ/AtpI family protein [Candidatus Peregrinibacteria bacterium]
MEPELSPIQAKKKDETQPMGLFLSLRLAWNLGYIIALPVVVFGFGGALADKKLGTSPLFIIAGFVLAALLTGVGVYRRVKEIVKS